MDDCTGLLDGGRLPRIRVVRTLVRMTTLGSNIRCVAATEHRAAIAAIYTEVFGASASQPIPDMDVYVLPGGGSIGVYIVPADQALAATLHESAGTWIELLVDEPDETRSVLERRGLTPLDYHDKAHAYFQFPGGQVFRLAARSSAS